MKLQLHLFPEMKENPVSLKMTVTCFGNLSAFWKDQAGYLGLGGQNTGLVLGFLQGCWSNTK